MKRAKAQKSSSFLHYIRAFQGFAFEIASIDKSRLNLVLKRINLSDLLLYPIIALNITENIFQLEMTKL